MTPRVAILRAPGTNRDRDLQRAFEAAGADARILLLEALIADPRPLHAAAIIALPGGFSFGDDLGAGRMLALTLGARLGDAIRAHLARGRFLLGICNGFQALLHAGLLTDTTPAPLSLVDNATPGFRSAWTTLDAAPDSACPFVAELAAGDPIDCPFAHAEGRLFAPSPETLDALEAAGQVAFRYRDNPNGSARAIAGISNAAGTALGLMPHPENHLFPAQHPRRATRGSGLPLFSAMVRAAR